MMKVNVNKELLIKHRFWIVLGVAFCVILTGMLLAYCEDSAKKQAEIQAAVNQKGQTAGGFENEQTIKVRQEDAKRARDLESNVWSKAYTDQEPIYMWAKRVEDEFHFRNGRCATAIKIDPLTDARAWPPDSPTTMYGILSNVQRDWFEIKDRSNTAVKFYLTQNVVDPDPKNKNVTVTGQKETPWGPVIATYVNKKVFVVTYQQGRYFNDPLTISEQKTFADSYRSQLHDILEIVDPLDADGNGVVQLNGWLFTRDDFPPESARFLRFVNMPWDPNNNFSEEAWIAQENLWIQKEIYQILRSANDKISNFDGKGGEEKGKAYHFKNSYFELSLLLNAENNLSFKIKNRLNKRQAIDLSFRVHMDKSRKPEILKISSFPLAPAGDKAGKDSYVQNFAHKKDDAPRKGIYSVEQVLSWETAAVKRIDHISIGSTSGGDISHSHRTFPVPLIDLSVLQLGGEGPLAGPPKAFAHGLWAKRYIEVSEQSRRIPVGIVVIVDQAHVDRVLTAFNNSKLRFLDTQVLLNLYPGSLQPLVSTRGGAGDAQSRTLTGGSPPSLETNMEMVIYGIVTLYQRYPPRTTAEQRKG